MTLDHLRCSWYKKAIQTRKRNYLREYIETDNNVFIIIVVKWIFYVLMSAAILMFSLPNWNILK